MGEWEPSERAGAMEDLLPEFLEDRLMGKGSQAPRAQMSPLIPPQRLRVPVHLTEPESAEHKGGETEGLKYHRVHTTSPTDGEAVSGLTGRFA